MSKVRAYALGLTALCWLGSTAHAQDPILLTDFDTAYTQDFDTLANTGTSNVLPLGWAILEAGTCGACNGSYIAGTGSGNAGDTYSFGAASSSERALGSLASGSIAPRYGALFRNDTGGVITSLTIAYTGEQWRRGTTSGSFDRLEFAYSLNATSLAPADGLWVDVTDLNFTTPNTTGGTGQARDGNLPENQTAISHTIVGLEIAAGDSFWIRWSDPDVGGSDDGLAIDDLSLTPAGVAGTDILLGITGGSLDRPDSGEALLRFTVSLSEPAPEGGVTFDIATVELVGPNAAIAGTDYTSAETIGALIPEGEDSFDFDVAILARSLPAPFRVDFSVQVSNLPDGVSATQDSALGRIVSPQEIYQIQGSGAASPLVNETVRTLGNIVTVMGPQGFFMQTPDVRDDGVLATSNGIYVFTGSDPATTFNLAVGDEIDLRGRVVEFFDFTQFSNTSPALEISIVGGSRPLPTAVVFDETLPSRDPSNPSCGEIVPGNIKLNNFECFEAMLIEVPEGVMSTGNQRFSSDLFAEVNVTAGPRRELRESGVRFPGINPADYPGIDTSGIPVWSGAPHIFELDFDKLDPVLEGTALTAGTRFSAMGALGFEFSDYELWPNEVNLLDINPIPGPVLEPRDARELRIATLNVLNLFDDVDDGNGEDILTTQQYQDKLNRLSSYIINVLRAPDVIAVQEVEGNRALQALAARINSVSFGTAPYQQFIFSTTNDPRFIRNGYLVRSDRVLSAVVEELGRLETITVCSGGLTSCVKHDRPPLLLTGVFVGGDDNLPFAVLNVHNRSLSGIDGVGSGPDRVRFKRFAQAQSIADMAQEFQTNPANASTPLVVTGDFNAFEFTDGYTDLVGAISGSYLDSENLLKLDGPQIVDPPLENALLRLPEEQRYTFTFFTERVGQTLDHALMSTVASSMAIRYEMGRGNADAAVEFGNNPPPGQRELRSSDHDGAVLSLVSDRMFGDGFEDNGFTD